MLLGLSPEWDKQSSHRLSRGTIAFYSEGVLLQDVPWPVKGALWAAIHQVFGSEQAVECCPNHKVGNVLNELPKQRHAEVRTLQQAAYRIGDASGNVYRVNADHEDFVLEAIPAAREQASPRAGITVKSGCRGRLNIPRVQQGRFFRAVNIVSRGPQLVDRS